MASNLTSAAPGNGLATSGPACPATPQQPALQQSSTPPVFGLRQALDLVQDEVDRMEVERLFGTLPTVTAWTVNLQPAQEAEAHAVACRLLRAICKRAEQKGRGDEARTIILNDCFDNLVWSTQGSKRALLAILDRAHGDVITQVTRELTPVAFRGLLDSVARSTLTNKEVQREAAAAISVLNQIASRMQADQQADIVNSDLVNSFFDILWADRKRAVIDTGPYDDMIANAIELLMTLCSSLSTVRRFELRKLFVRLRVIDYIDIEQPVVTKRQKYARNALCLLDEGIAKARDMCTADEQATGPLFRPGSLGDQLIRRIKGFRSPAGFPKVVIYLIGAMGTCKSSFIHTLTWLLKNDKAAEWPTGEPTVSSTGDGSTTIGLHEYKNWDADFVIMDTQGIEHAQFEHIKATLSSIAEGQRTECLHALKWDAPPPPPPSWLSQIQAWFLAKKSDKRPHLVLKFFNASSSNFDEEEHFKMIQAIRDKGVRVQPVITKAAKQLAKSAAGLESLDDANTLHEPRCLGKSQRHGFCTNCTLDQNTELVANHTCAPINPVLCTACKEDPNTLHHASCCLARSCTEMLWKQKLGEKQSVYVLEPFRAGESCEKNDFKHLGAHNALEILKCIDQALKDAARDMEQRNRISGTAK